MRSRAKVINFGLLYGMGPQRVARETGMSVPEARAFIDRYFATFPSVQGWMERLLAEARMKGYVETLSGRRRRIQEITSGDNRARTFAENAAINTPVQGSAADIIKKAMLRVHERLSASRLACRMLLQVHDELLFEVPLTELADTRALIQQEMESAWELAVPLKVDCGQGPNWLAAH
jgi:DNA polymerase I